jgi:hypothetical protein
MGANISFVGCEVCWEEEAIERLLNRMQPDLILHIASLVSPWELEPGSRWAELVRRGGFGISLPLQAALVSKVANVMSYCAPDCSLINASYPDAVNPVIAALGLPVLCGVGNVAILAAGYAEQNSLGVPVSILAHHSDLSQIASSDAPTVGRVRIWVGDTEIEDIDPGVFQAIRQIRGAELNHVTGATIAKLLQQLATGESFRCHLPGPNGLPGGYPVQFSAMKVSLDLPAGLTNEEAIAHNQESAGVEGVRVKDGIVQFSDRASQAIRELVPECPTAFPVFRIHQIAQLFDTLRD